MDPYEFRNLADAAEQAAVLADLKQQLAAWRRQTQDPLRDEANLKRLTAEIQAVSRKAEGQTLAWGYPDYFFGREPAPAAAPLRKKGRKSP
jgi:hypothetical protein